MLHGSFLIDALGSFPINVVLIAADPANPYGIEYSEQDASASVRARSRRPCAKAGGAPSGSLTPPSDS